MNDSWYLMFERYNKDILRRKGHLVMFVSRRGQDLTWITRQPSSNNVRLAWLFPMNWWSKRWFCFVQIDQTYQPWHKRCSLPQCGEYLATSNISPNNKVNRRYNGQCSKKEPFATSGGQIQQIDKTFHKTTSLSKRRQEWFGGRKDSSVGGIAQLKIQKKLSVEKRRETHHLHNKENEEWIEDYVDREPTVARKPAQDAERAIMQEQEHTRNVDMGRSTTTKPETTFEAMLNAIGDSLSDLASSEDKEDVKDEDDDKEVTELRKLSKEEEPGWVMGTISKTVRHRMESFRQMQIRLDQLTQLGWGDAADIFLDRDM